VKVRKLQNKRVITFKTFCKYCDRNGANHQEYGRLCPSPDECLVTHKPKCEKSCKRWNRLRIAYSIEEIEEKSGGLIDRIKHMWPLHLGKEVEV